MLIYVGTIISYFFINVQPDNVYVETAKNMVSLQRPNWIPITQEVKLHVGEVIRISKTTMIEADFGPQPQMERDILFIRSYNSTVGIYKMLSCNKQLTGYYKFISNSNKSSQLYHLKHGQWTYMDLDIIDTSDSSYYH